MKFKQPNQFKVGSSKIEIWSKTAAEDPILLWSIIVWLCGIIISIIVLTVFYIKIPDQVPLFYSLPWGESQLVNRNYLFILPGLLFLFGGINLLASLISYPDNKVISYLLITAMIVITIFFCLSTINLVHLIT